MAVCCFLVVPHKDKTFDHNRPVTSLNHLEEDLDNDVDEDDLTHLPEILELHDLRGNLPKWAIMHLSRRDRRITILIDACINMYSILNC